MAFLFSFYAPRLSRNTLSCRNGVELAQWNRRATNDDAPTNQQQREVYCI
jgi:hypothetical protein